VKSGNGKDSVQENDLGELLVIGESRQEDGVFSELEVHESKRSDHFAVVIVVNGLVAKALSLATQRCSRGSLPNSLLEVLAKFADDRLAVEIAAPEAENGRGIVYRYADGKTSIVEKAEAA